MAARRVIIARRALDDLKDIHAYLVAAASGDVASRVVSEILDATERLAEMPGMGHTRNDLPGRYRAWRVFRFLIIYRFDQRSIFVTRVIRGHRDIRRILRSR